MISVVFMTFTVELPANCSVAPVATELHLVFLILLQSSVAILQTCVYLIENGLYAVNLRMSSETPTHCVLLPGLQRFGDTTPRGKNYG